MFKNKSADGRNNLCGKKIAELRRAQSPYMSQRMLATVCSSWGWMWIKMPYSAWSAASGSSRILSLRRCAAPLVLPRTRFWILTTLRMPPNNNALLFEMPPAKPA